MKKILCQPYLALILATSLTLSACGSSNTSAGPAPNTGNIPNLAARPSSQATQVKKLSLAGNIFNGLNQQPVEKAEITLHIISVKAPPPANKKESDNTNAQNNGKDTPNPTANPKGKNASPNSTPSTAPNGSTPTITPDPFASPSSNFSPDPLPGILPGGIPGPALPGGEGQPLDPNNPLPEDAMPEAHLQSSFLLATGSANGAAFQIAQNSQTTKGTDSKSTDKTDDDVPNVFNTTSNNRGKFFINDVPDGTYMVTITAPGYRSLTLTNINPNNLSIPLTPLTASETVDVVGMVLSPSENPVEDAFVSPSFPLGEAVGIPATSNSLGEFLLPAVQQGKHSILAFVMDDRQDIQQMGLVMNLPLSTKSLKEKATALDPKILSTPTPTKSSIDDAERKKLEQSVENLLIEDSPSPEENPAENSVDVSPEPPMASPIIEPAASPESPEVDASASPDAPPATTTEPSDSTLEELTENEEEPTEKKGFNLLKAVTELVTGEKADKDSNDDKNIYPIIPLRSVLNSVKFAGTVTLPEAYELRQLEVYLTLPAAEGDHPEEIYLFSRSFASKTPKTDENATKISDKKSADSTKKTIEKDTPDKKTGKKDNSQRYQVNLPELSKGQAYHLQFTGSHEGGQLAYHHLYNLSKSDDELATNFMAAPAMIELEGEEVNAIPPVPGMGWEAVTGADLYHLTLESGKGADRRIIWEAFTAETQIRYPLTSKEHRLKEDKTYTLSVAALKGLRPAANSSKEKYAHPAYRNIWSDLARVTHRPFEVVD